MSWIDSVLTTTDAAECPKKFLKWALYTILGTAAKRNVYFSKQGVYRVYPNIYCLIIADSGFRKGYAASTATKIIKPIKHIRIISGSTTIQKVLKNISGPLPAPDGSKNEHDASLCMISGEFTNLIKADPQAITFLTELYDACYLDEWTYDTKNAGTFGATNVVVSLLGATTKEHFNGYFETKDISGGFLARTMIITSSSIGKLNSLVGGPDIPEIDLSPHRKYLDVVSRIPANTQMRMTPDAETCYNEWYYPFFEEKNIKEQSSRDKTGFVMRSQDHVLKLAMVLSLARSLDFTIQAEDIEEALSEVFESARDINSILFGRPTTNNAPLGTSYKKALDAIIHAPNHEMSRERLLRKFYGEFDAMDLNRMVQGMEETGLCKTIITNGKISYRVENKVLEAYFKVLESKKKGTSPPS